MFYIFVSSDGWAYVGFATIDRPIQKWEVEYRSFFGPFSTRQNAEIACNAYNED